MGVLHGSSGAEYPEVSTFADLPSAAPNVNKIYLVKSTTGVVLVNRKAAGLYMSDGADWNRISDNSKFLRTSATSGADNRLIKTDGVTGNGAQETGITVDDSNNVSGVGTLTIGAGLVATQSQTDFISGVIESPADQDYKLIVKSPYGMTITETTTISASGTCTATFKINSTALGGTANSVSTGEQSQAHSSDNVVAVGDDIVLTVSSNSSCEDLSFTIKFTRTLA